MNHYMTQTNPSFTLCHGDCREIIKQLPDKSVNAIFADPPYFLSNGGISVQSGKVVCVDKGDWDKGGTPEKIDAFNEEWIGACRNKLTDDGSIWISGTYHNIFSVANTLTKLGFRILNVITWAKTNPPPNISCRFFTYSTEFIIWARKHEKKPHYFNYELMRLMNGEKQMTDVWQLPAIAPWEKSQGKHPTQKPLKLLHRIILASTRPGDTVLDPFAGSSTTGIAANLLGRKFIGIEQSQEFVDLSIRRRKEIEDEATAKKMLAKICENQNGAMVMVNHARKELREKMIETGICYMRIGDSKGSVLVGQGFERLQYVLLHTNGEDCQLFNLKNTGRYQIWTKEELEKKGFTPEHGECYLVLRFDSRPIDVPKNINLNTKKYTFVPKIMPMSDFLVY